MKFTIRTVTPQDDIPAVLSLALAKAHLRVEHDAEDAPIAAYVSAAQDAVERHCSRFLTAREAEISYSAFPGSCEGYAFDLPRDPVTAITAIAYTDSDGVAAELEEADWRWSEAAPNLVRPAYDTSWPSAYAEAGAVRVTFDAGYEDGLCPPSLVQAVKLLLTHLYDNRGAMAGELPAGVVSLCRPYRRVAL